MNKKVLYDWRIPEMACNFSRGVRLLVFCFIPMASVLFSSPAFGKDLYVNASTGSDSWTWVQNSSSQPWATLTKAVQAAVAGDTVYVLPGTYTGAGTGSRWTSAFNPTNSGTSGNPITFIGTAGVVLRTDMVAGPIIGADGRNYITWRNFVVDESNYLRASDTCSVVLHETTGSVIDNVEVIGRALGVASDNHSGIRIEAANNITIKNSKLHGMYGLSGHHHNTGGIMTYGVSNSVFENNEIYDTDSGIYLKGAATGYSINGNIVRYNYFHDLYSSAVLLYYGYTNTSIYQNIIYGAFIGVKLDDTVSLAGTTIYNNTIVNSGTSNGSIYGQTIAAGPVVVKNNIVYGGLYGAQLTTYSYPVSFHHNNYYGQTGAGGWYVGTTQTWAQWTAGISGGELGSIRTDPLFVNASTRDYRLQAGSPARTASDTGGAIGAYIAGTETIGLPVMPPMSGIMSSGGGGGGGGGVGGGCSITATRVDSINASSIVNLCLLIAPAILLFVRKL